MIPVLRVAAVCCFAGVLSAADRLDEFRAELDLQQEASRHAVEQYCPSAASDVTHADVPSVDILRQLPGVVAVDSPLAADEPALRVVHVKDWHFVPKAAFAADLRDQSDEPLDDAEIDDLYAAHLLEVEIVQTEQMALLRCLIKHHGLRAVHMEGLTEPDVPIFKARVRVLKKLGTDIAEYRELTEDVNDAKLRAATEQLAEQHRLGLLQLGAAGRLYLPGELPEVIPLDGSDALAAANPPSDAGAIDLDPKATEAREDAIAKRLASKGGFALIILGGGPDLTDNLRRHAPGAEYIVVTTRHHCVFARW